MAKKTVEVPPKEQPEQVVRRMEEVVGLSPGQRRAPGQKDVLSRLTELEERVEERSEKIEQLYSLIEDLGDKINDILEKEINLDKRLINEGVEFSDLVGKIERLDRRSAEIFTRVDQEDKDFRKVESEVENIKFLRLEANREVNQIQNWVESEVEVLRQMIEELATEVTKTQ